MAKIPEQYLDRLRAAGLVVSGPIVSSHVAYPDGVCVGKPESVAGHSLPGLKGHWDLQNSIVVDAPVVYLHCDGQRWMVTCHEYVPGPGPGDFVNRWAKADEAIDDILDFYFGSSARMDVKRDARLETERRAQDRSLRR